MTLSTFCGDSRLSRALLPTTVLILACEMPAVVLADLFGIGTSTVDRWRQWAGGTWAAYEMR